MRVPLLSGPYQSRSVIASAQRSVNLYPESNAGDPQAPVPVTHYPTPGLTLFVDSGDFNIVRCMYRSTAGKLYVVIGTNVYYVTEGTSLILLGVVEDKRTTCYMADNGLAIVLVDGSATGYAIDMETHDYSIITDVAFFGADNVLFLDTYFIFNRPNSNQFYISRSFATYAMLIGGTAFDPLDIAAKTGAADNIVNIATVNRVLILIGELTTEYWMNTGSADFTFQQVQGVFIQHGCGAKYSVYSQDISTFWLQQDLQGKAVIVQNKGYGVERISTHAIEADIQSYTIISDAIGFGYQQEGHAFYVLIFPHANKTWVYELKNAQWHEWLWTDTNGELLRHRSNCCAFAYGKNMVGDWQNGKLYQLDLANYTDDNNPVVRIRSFPHMLDDGVRLTYHSFIVDMQTGTIGEGQGEAVVSLRWSDNKGVTFGDPVTQLAGSLGQYLTQVSYNRLGMGRDRIFEVSWSSPFRTALNGAFVQFAKFRT